MFNKAVIIGVGQIGASLGMNLVAKRLAREVVGVGRLTANLAQARRRKAIHRGVAARSAASLLSRLGQGDLVVLAAPVRSIRSYCRLLPKDVLVIDCGSTKELILREADRLSLRFVGCHPVAGTERGGAEAGDRGLFSGHLCVVTPGRRAGQRDVSRVESLWRSFGAKPIRMKAHDHDRLFAATSHLPHVISYALAAAEGRLLRLPKDARFVFSSLRGMTRIALSPPAMWTDIFLENRSWILRALAVHQKEIERLKGMIVKKKSNDLFTYLESARKNRLRLLEAG